MKFISFIKAYKFALASVSEKISDWPTAYLGSVHFPDEDDKITFIFSTGPYMQTGDLALSASISIPSLERYRGGLKSIAEATGNSLDKDTLAKEYVRRNVEINEVGRVVVLLDVLLEKLKLITDDWENSILKDIQFNFENDLARFDVDDMRILTNGCLVSFGE